MTASLQPVTVDRSHDELAARLRLAVARLARRLRREAGGDISPSQLSALASVAHQGPLTLSELSAIEQVQPPTMTRVVAHLEEQGLLTRTVDPEDRRVARVTATSLGEQFLDEARRRKNTYLAARLASMTAGDREALAQALEVLEHLAEQE